MIFYMQFKFFKLWASPALEFAALAGQKAAYDPQWPWGVPRYRSFGGCTSSAHGDVAHLADHAGLPGTSLWPALG